MYLQVEEILERVKEEEPGEEEGNSSMVLDATAEFCRTLGDIPTYGLAGNRDHDAEIMVMLHDIVPAIVEESNGVKYTTHCSIIILHSFFVSVNYQMILFCRNKRIDM